MKSQEYFVDECDRLHGEVKEKDEQIKMLTSELENAEKRVQELEHQAHEAMILEEEFKRLSPR